MSSNLFFKENNWRIAKLCDNCKFYFGQHDDGYGESTSECNHPDNKGYSNSTGPYGLCDKHE